MWLSPRSFIALDDLMMVRSENGDDMPATVHCRAKADDSLQKRKEKKDVRYDVVADGGSYLGLKSPHVSFFRDTSEIM
jgi:hypothetical protein